MVIESYLSEVAKKLTKPRQIKKPVYEHTSWKGILKDLLQIIGQTTIHNIVQLVSSRDHSLKAIGQLNCKLKTRSSQMNWFTYNNTLSTLKSRHGTLMVATQRGSSRSTNTKYGLKRVTANNHMNLIPLQNHNSFSDHTYIDKIILSKLFVSCMPWLLRRKKYLIQFLSVDQLLIRWSTSFPNPCTIFLSNSPLTLGIIM